MGVVLWVVSLLALNLILGLDRWEAFMFSPIVIVGSWLVFILVNLAIIDFSRAS